MNYLLNFKVLLAIILIIITVTFAKPEPNPQAPNQYPYPPQPGLHPQQPPVHQTPILTAFEGKSCIHTFECDAANTVLTCHRGKCTCPNRPHISWVRGHHQLNTEWDPNLRKCLSIKGSACDVFNPKVVFCGSGYMCREASAKEGFGYCSTSRAGAMKKLSTTLAIIGIFIMI